MQVIDTQNFKKSLQPLIDSIELLGRKNFPFTRKALKKGAYHIADYWIQSAQGNPIEGTSETVRDADYAKSIQVEQSGDYRYVIGSTDGEKHRKISEGTPARDQKLGLRGYKKTRYSKKGDPYLIVPFRHSTKSMKSAKRRSSSSGKTRSVSNFFRKSAKSMITHNDPVSHQRTYRWAGTSGFAAKVLGTHKSDIYSGMTRFETSTGKSSSSAYMTFRVMSSKSDPKSWIIPAKKGIDITNLVFEATKDTVVNMVEFGIMADFKTLGVIK